MSITFGDYLIDSGYHDITPEQEREIWAREECKRRGIDPDEICADGGVEAWMVVAKDAAGCAICGQMMTWQHDHRPDWSGLDDGPYLRAPRKKAAPKPAEEMKRIRAQAWATRRKKYGKYGHR